MIDYTHLQAANRIINAFTGFDWKIENHRFEIEDPANYYYKDRGIIITLTSRYGPAIQIKVIVSDKEIAENTSDEKLKKMADAKVMVARTAYEEKLEEIENAIS